MGGLAFAATYFGLRSGSELMALPKAEAGAGGHAMTIAEYDKMAKLCFNENPWGPPESVMEAMKGALKFANRYGNPDGGLVEAIAESHGVSPENVLLGAGSTEILDVSAETFLEGGKKMVGSRPSYSMVYEFARGVKSDAIEIPLLPDFRQDIPGIIAAVNERRAEIGLVYICNPNNPTGGIVSKTDIKKLLDGIPPDMPVLIDEAYFHYVEDPEFATSIPYVKEGRQVLVARTFSKIVGLAGMRLGYAIAPTPIIERMTPRSIASINAIVKWGGAAAIKDTEAQAKVKSMTLELRKKTTTELTGLGYECLPSETNFFMVHIRRPIRSVIPEFRHRGVLVGRPFPPMDDYMRVSVGNAEEMGRFMAAFKEIFQTPATVSKPA